MKNLLLSLLSVMLSVMLGETALLGQHVNRYGSGSTYHAQGSDSTTRTTGYGGEATHTRMVKKLIFASEEFTRLKAHAASRS